MLLGLYHKASVSYVPDFIFEGYDAKQCRLWTENKMIKNARMRDR
jgi:hypothetical protein